MHVTPEKGAPKEGGPRQVPRSPPLKHTTEYELREGGIQSRRLSWLQASEGSSKLLRPKGFRRYCDPQVLESSIGRTAAFEWPGGLAAPSVPRSSEVARRWNFPKRGTGERSVQTCQ